MLALLIVPKKYVAQKTCFETQGPDNYLYFSINRTLCLKVT